MENRQERLLLETERHRIAGTLTLAKDGYRSRISDLLNAPDREFFPLTDVTISPRDMQQTAPAGAPIAQRAVGAARR